MLHKNIIFPVTQIYFLVHDITKLPWEKTSAHLKKSVIFVKLYFQTTMVWKFTPKTDMNNIRSSISEVLQWSVLQKSFVDIKWQDFRTELNRWTVCCKQHLQWLCWSWNRHSRTSVKIYCSADI
jgi:hypothetical protein